MSVGSIAAKIGKTLGKVVAESVGLDGVLGRVKQKIDTILGPDVDPLKKAEIDAAIKAAEREFEIKVMGLHSTMMLAMNEFFLQHEGTAKELLALGAVGKGIIALRSVIRPAITIWVMFLLDQIARGRYTPPEAYAETIHWAIVIALGFWFGERFGVNMISAKKGGGRE